MKSEQQFWDEATKSKDLRNEWICDKDVTDQQCLDAILPYLKKGKTLDLGCGIGRLTTDYGVDISPKMLALARRGPQYKLTDGKHIPYPNNFFDNVFSMALFQHILDSEKENYIKEVHRVLKNGGVFRLQFVIGDEIAPFSYQTRGFDLGEFTIIDLEDGLIFEEWRWLTLEK